MSVRTHATPTRDPGGTPPASRKKPGRAARRQDTAAGDGQAARRHAAIAREAYFLAERRGFAPGYELDDWLAAEAAMYPASPHATSDDPAGERPPAPEVTPVR